MNIKIKLNIKSIIKTEQFLKKPFSVIDYSDESDVNALLYCVAIMNNNLNSSYETFLLALKNKPVSEKIYKAFEEESQFIAQFTSLSNAEQQQVEPGEPPYIKDIVSTLIVDGGIDANCLYESNITDLNLFIEAYEKKKRESMESSRLWTFLTCAPHIDVKKIKTARDFYAFPWEMEQIRAEEMKYMEENEGALNEFLEKGMKYITGNK